MCPGGGQSGFFFLRGGPAALSGGFRGAHLANAEAFQDIADLDVAEIGDACAAFKTSANFAGVVLERLKGVELRRIVHRAFTQNAHWRVASRDSTDRVPAGDLLRASGPERVRHVRPAEV